VAFVSFTTDFGPVAAAICRGVVLTIAPDATVVDLTADVPAFDIRAGSIDLWYAIPYLPVGIHVGIVDPGVGTDRLAVAIQTARGDVLIGPDNGLLIPAAERAGGITRAHALEASAYRLPTVTTTFHGRDVFAPAAGHVATGTPLEAFGRALDPASLVRLREPRPQAIDGGLSTEVIAVDSFGNLYLAGGPADLAAAIGELVPGRSLLIGAETATWAETFGGVAPGALLLFEDSDGRLCLAVNQASARARTGLREGDTLLVRGG
jgi:hypothetical protein